MFLIFPDPVSIADYVSSLLVRRIKQKPDIVLGLATGGTMEPIYEHFVAQASKQGLDVSQLTSFNLDEYVGLSPDHPKSYAAYMHERLFKHLGFDASRHYLPDGLATDIEQHCLTFSEKIQQSGGIELQLLGVGSNGHIGFNEPGTSFDSRCHLVELSEQTRIDNSRFFAKGAIVPAHAITMGLRDIMDAREILLIATGQAKAAIIAAYHESDITESIPFTILKQHPNAKIILDAAAASRLPEGVRRQYAVAEAEAARHYA